MPTIQQKVALGDELLTAIRLLKCGLRELNRMDGTHDFYHMPIQLLALGFERMMKVVICCHYFAVNGDFPKRQIFHQGKKGHDLIPLQDKITRECFSDKYLEKIPAARQDIGFLRNDKQLRRIVRILSDFGTSARYYDLNIVLNEKNQVSSPEAEWQKLEMEILQEDKKWEEKIRDPSWMNEIHKKINKKLTVHCERFARSLSRLFTIGGLGEEAGRISPHTHDFLFLMDDQLGEQNYENVRL